MNELIANHPINIVRGALIFIDRIAKKCGLGSVGVFARDAATAADQSKAVFQEIGADAKRLKARLALYLEDGVIDAAERSQLEREIDEIGTEATEGRVIE